MPRYRYHFPILTFISFCVTSALIPLYSQTPPTPRPPGSLIEIKSEAPPTALIDWVVIEPPDLDSRTYESNRIFVTTGLSKTGTIKVLEIQYLLPSPPENKPTLVKTFHTFTVGPPLPPAPVVLPTAKLTADKPNIQAGESVTLTWVTTGADKVTLDGVEVEPEGQKVLLPLLPTNLYTLIASTADHTIYAQQVVTIGEKPPPVPSPITEKGFRVLIVEETEERINLTPTQREILLSLADGSVRKFLEEHCVKDSKGNPEYRILDKDNDLSKDSKVWQDAWKLPHTPLPYIIASNGVTGYAAPIGPTQTPSDIIAILQRIAGP